MKKLKYMLYTLLLSMMVALVSPSIIPMPGQIMQVEAAVKINKKKVTLIKGQKVTLKITGTKSKIKWSSNKKSVASVSSKGKVTAKKKGSSTITAKIGKKKYTCKVTVEEPKLSKKTLTLSEGKTYSLKLNGTKQKITWKSSNKDIATVDKSGNISAKSEGTTTITATVLKKKYKCTLKVESNLIKYREGMYKVGVDIPAGQYVLYSTSDWGAYFAICSDSTGRLESIISNDNFNINSIIEIKSGEYLELTRCYAVPASSVKVPMSNGEMFRVGIDIPAGEYRLEMTSTYWGYYEVASDARHDLYSIITNNNFENQAYVTVQEGQFLKLSGCRLSAVNTSVDYEITL